MRTMLADSTVELNIVPVDRVISMMITLAWYIGTQTQPLSLQQKQRMLPVFHCCGVGKQTGKRCVTLQQWREYHANTNILHIIVVIYFIVDTIFEQLETNKIGFERCLRWPQLSLTRNT